MTTTTRVCVGAAEHRPVYAEVDRHHVFPLYLCSLLGVPARRETVDLCSGCHDLVHHVLRHRINSGTAGGHRLPAGARDVVERAWRWWQEVLG